MKRHLVERELTLKARATVLPGRAGLRGRYR